MKQLSMERFANDPQVANDPRLVQITSKDEQQQNFVAHFVAHFVALSGLAISIFCSGRATSNSIFPKDYMVIFAIHASIKYA